MRPIINSIKHYVQFPVTTIASGAAAHSGLANATVAPAVSTTNAVNIGSLVKAIYVEMWVDGDITEATVVAIISKRPADVAAPTFTEMNNLMSWSNKKNILQTHQGLPPAGDNILPIFREWIKIPKGKQRMGQDDKITLSIAATGTEIHFCGFCTYKEYQ